MPKTLFVRPFSDTLLDFSVRDEEGELWEGGREKHKGSLNSMTDLVMKLAELTGAKATKVITQKENL